MYRITGFARRLSLGSHLALGSHRLLSAYKPPMEEDGIRSLCKLYLSWEHHEKITVERLGKGCSNDILIATLWDEEARVVDRALVRKYGCNIISRLVDDVYINCYLGTLGRIPKIRGLFEGGRFEEYLPCTIITREKFRERYGDVIRILSEVHSTDMPLPRDLFLDKYLRGTVEKVGVNREKWEVEVAWYLDVLSKVGPHMGVTFCHNDMNMNNMLIPDDNPESLVLIDYEYAGYNYSLFDIANYCCELQYDWSHEQPPYFLFSDAWLPDDTALLEMLKVYNSLVKSRLETPAEVMLSQLKFLMIGSELFWTLWSQALEQGFCLDMEDYLRVKSESYFKKKESFQGEIEELLKYQGLNNGFVESY